MYHGPKMCRTCLQMSRGDFKFVSLDSVDPLWESNSPNLKAQLMSLVPEMKIDASCTFICTSCFIALRTAFEFKRMCQVTEQKFQAHNFKFRRPFGVGPGSPQFHVTLNENRNYSLTAVNNNNNNAFHSQKLNYLQADTSIDITEHHLYDASKSLPRRIHYVNSSNNSSVKLQEVDVLKPQNCNVQKKPLLNSQELKEKFNLGSQISIVKAAGKTKRVVIKSNPDENLNKFNLKDSKLEADALRCRVRIEVLTHRYVLDHTLDQYTLDDIKSASHSYYFGKLDEPLTCEYCAKMFTKRHPFHMHQIEEHSKTEKVTCVKTEPGDLSAQIKTEDKPLTIKTESSDLTESSKRPTNRQILKFHFRKYKRCSMCKKTCVSWLHLLQHCKYVHVPRSTRKKSLIKRCLLTEEPQCPRQLRVRTGHPFASAFRCSICDKGFVNERELEVHMYVHTPVILSMDDTNDSKDDDSECLFTCYLCGKSFLKERFLKLHNIQVHLRNKLTTCKICGRAFKSEFWYDRHKCALPPEETAPDEVPDDTNMFPCSFCERKFSQLRFMKVHRRRSHKHLMINRGPKELSADSPILDGTKEADPMELYSIAGTTSFADEAQEVGENDSDSEAFSDAEDPMDLAVRDDFGEVAEVAQNGGGLPKFEEKAIKVEAMPPVMQVLMPEPARRGRPPLHKEGIIKPQTEMPELEALSRRGNRGLPKIQCDFCGELIEENRYDKHIAEHNKSRLQRRVSTTTTHIEEYDSDDFPLKCPVCYKGFKRKYYYNTHINKHIEDGIDVPEAPVSPPNDGVAHAPSLRRPIEYQPGSDDDSDESYNSESDKCLLAEDDIQGQEIIMEDNTKLYVCCGRSFKLKAHFFRHYKIKHPNNVRKRNPIRYADSDTIILSLPTDGEYLEVKKIPPKIPDFTVTQTRKIEPLTEVKIKQEVPNDLEICLPDDLEIGKRKRTEIDNFEISSKKVKTENPDAVKLRNTVAAHLEDIEIVPVSPSVVFKYECPQCEKRFKQKSQLRDHMNIHTGEKPYKCEFCQPVHGFTQSSSLYFHIRKVHTNVMKNVSWAIQSKSGLCLICLEAFERHTSMYSHLRQNYVENGFDCEICAKTVGMTCHYKVHNIDPNDMDSFMLPQQNLEVVLTEDAESHTSSCASVDENHDESLNEADSIMSKARRCEPCGKIFKSLQYYNMHIKGSNHKQREIALSQKIDPNIIDLPSEVATEPETPNPTQLANNTLQETADIETMKEIENNCKAITKKIQRIGTFKCPTCSLLFITKTNLRKHRRTAHVKHPRHKKTEGGGEDSGSELNDTFDAQTDVSCENESMNVVENEGVGSLIKTEPVDVPEIGVKIEAAVNKTATDETEVTGVEIVNATDVSTVTKSEVEIANETDVITTADETKTDVITVDATDVITITDVTDETDGVKTTNETGAPTQTETKDSNIVKPASNTEIVDVSETSNPPTTSTKTLNVTETYVLTENGPETSSAAASTLDSLTQPETSTFNVTESSNKPSEIGLENADVYMDPPPGLQDFPIEDLPNELSLAEIINATKTDQRCYIRPIDPSRLYPSDSPASKFFGNDLFDSPDYLQQAKNFQADFILGDEEPVSGTGPDLNPEQELLALLHTSGDNAYDTRKSYDAEQEFIDLETAGSTILKQASEETDENFYERNSSSGLPLSILNEMKHDFR